MTKREKKKNYNKVLKSIKANSYRYDVLNHLINNRNITSKESFDTYGVTRLPAIIYDLKNKYNIPIKATKVEGVTNSGRKIAYSSYSIG